MPLEDCLDAHDDALSVDPALRDRERERKREREKEDDTGRRRIGDQGQYVFGDERMTLDCKDDREKNGRVLAASFTRVRRAALSPPRLLLLLPFWCVCVRGFRGRRRIGEQKKKKKHVLTFEP